MKDYKCLIYVEFYKGGPRYLFGVPVFEEIKEGTELIVKTVNGNQEVVAVTDSFIVNYDALKNIMKAFNQNPLQLKYVQSIILRKKEIIDIQQGLSQVPKISVDERDEYLPF